MKRLLPILMLLALVGCKGKELVTERVEVPVVVTQTEHTQTTKVDIVRDTLVHRDSVIFRDSIYHFVKGDTVIIEKWHYATNNHHYTNNNVQTRVDTLVKVDSIPYPVTTEKVITQVKEVEKKLKWWQKLLMWLGGIALVAGGLGIAYKIGIKK